MGVRGGGHRQRGGVRPGNYGFIDARLLADAAAVNGGVGGGEGYEPRVLFYVGVDDVEAALARAEALGGRRVLGPDGVPGTLVVGRFTDPEGNLVGVAGTASAIAAGGEVGSRPAECDVGSS